MTVEERELIAEAYDSGVIKVCVATCSLAAGINRKIAIEPCFLSLEIADIDLVPARRVILHNARMGRDLVGPSLL